MAKGDIDFVINALNGFTERVVKKITLDVTANLIVTTPVDTGWARANWVPSIGKPFAPDLRGIAADPALVPGQAATQQAGVASVATSYRLEQGRVFVSNNVPYIQRLNMGSSKQAPSGFVQNAIVKAVTVDIRGIK